MNNCFSTQAFIVSASRSYCSCIASFQITYRSAIKDKERRDKVKQFYYAHLLHKRVAWRTFSFHQLLRHLELIVILVLFNITRAFLQKMFSLLLINAIFTAKNSFVNYFAGECERCNLFFQSDGCVATCGKYFVNNTKLALQRRRLLFGFNAFPCLLLFCRIFSSTALSDLRLFTANFCINYLKIFRVVIFLLCHD